jgi:hypothetical protein
VWYKGEADFIHCHLVRLLHHPPNYNTREDSSLLVKMSIDCYGVYLVHLQKRSSICVDPPCRQFSRRLSSTHKVSLDCFMESRLFRLTYPAKQLPLYFCEYTTSLGFVARSLLLLLILKARSKAWRRVCMRCVAENMVVIP